MGCTACALGLIAGCGDASAPADASSDGTPIDGASDGGGQDAPSDAASRDADPTEDAPSVDGGGDTGTRMDSGLSDSGPSDTGLSDVGASDAGALDTGPSDAGADAGMSGPLRVFVTSTRTHGDFGASGDPRTFANAACQERADSVGLGGRWHAWLRIDDSLATDHIAGEGPWISIRDGVSPDDAVLFANRAQFATGPISDQWSDENGAPDPWLFTWTGANHDERPLDRDCENWTSGAGNRIGTAGRIGRTNAEWDDGHRLFCDISAAFYCFEQP